MNDDLRNVSVNELAAMIDEIDDVGEGLSDWEIDFIASMVERIEVAEKTGDGLVFSKAERAVIDRIYEQRCCL